MSKLYAPFELFGVEVGKGWRPLVEPIYNRIQELNAQGAEIEISQIKEKFGELCIYVHNAPDEIRDMIDFAVEKSHHVCEHCGKPAEWIISTNDWYFTLCPDCLRERNITVKSTVEETELK